MSLMDEYSIECTHLAKTFVADGLGGYKTKWTEGTDFTAAWEYQDAPEITVAEQQGVARTYRIYVDKTLTLDFHDAFRRKDDDQVYRVVNPGTDRHTPGFSMLNKRLVEVEKWELPTDEQEEEQQNVQSGGGT